jgi:Tfp pilus assembly protein FimT
MVVVVLIGIMTALIIPEMKGTFEDALLRSQCRDLANACQTAYSRAVTLNQVHRVRMDARGEQFYIERREREGEFVRLRDVPGSEGKLDSRISVKISKAAEEATEEPLFPTATESRAADHDETLVFYPDGTSERAEILLQDRDGFRLVLRLNPVTARVQVLELARQ